MRDGRCTGLRSDRFVAAPRIDLPSLDLVVHCELPSNPSTITAPHQASTGPCDRIRACHISTPDYPLSPANSQQGLRTAAEIRQVKTPNGHCAKRAMRCSRATKNACLAWIRLDEPYQRKRNRAWVARLAGATIARKFSGGCILAPLARGSTRARKICRCNTPSPRAAASFGPCKGSRFLALVRNEKPSTLVATAGVQ